MIRHAPLLFVLLSCLGCSSLGKFTTNKNTSEPVKQNSESSISQLGQALPEMKPGDERELKIVAADQMVQHGHWDEAIELYLEAESMSSKGEKLDSKLAPAFAGAGKFAQSISRYQRLIAKSPKDSSLANNYAYTLMESGDLQAAELEYRRALSLDPKCEAASVNLGMLLARQQRFDEAIEMQSASVGQSSAHHNVAVVCIELGDEQRALQHLRIACSIPGASKTTQELREALESYKR